MAFKLNSFVDDQVSLVKDTLSPTNVIERVTPVQVKQILNTNPKEAINNALDNLTGVKLGQQFDEIGQQFLSQVDSFVQGSITQIQAQVAGCINKAIRDILEKNPLLEKIIFFDQFINRELSDIKNKLESKIDLELRKIAYKKIKIQQVALFKQKIALTIKNICPDATPASPSQVKQYKDILNKVKDSFKGEGVVEELPIGENITKGVVNNTVNIVDVEEIKSTAQNISTTLQKKLKEDPITKGQVQEETVTNVIASIKEQANKQIAGQNNISWEGIYG